MTISAIAKISLIILFAAIVMPYSTFGQRKHTADSLTHLLQSGKVQKTARVEVLNNLADLYCGNDSAKSYQYALDARQMAEKLNYKAGIAKSYLIVGVNESYKTHYKEADANFKKAEAIYTAVKMDNELGNVYQERGVALGLINLYEESLVPLKKAEQIHRRLKNDAGLVDDLRNLGMGYRKTMQIPKAIEAYMEAVKISEKDAKIESRSGTYINLAELLTAEKNYAEAERYYNAAIKILINNNDDLNLAIAYVNLAQTTIYQSKYEEGRALLAKAIPLFNKVKYMRGVQVCYNTLGAIYIRQQMYQESLPHLQKSLDISEQTKVFAGKALSLSDMGFSLTHLDRLKEARLYLDSAEKTAVKYKYDRSVFGEIYNRYATLDSALKDYKGALMNRNRYLLIKDSTLNVSLSKQVSELQIKYQTEKKESQIILLDKENLNKSLQLKNQQLELSQNKFQLTQQAQALTINQLELKNKNQKIENQQLDVQNKEASITSLKKESHIQKLEIANTALKLRQRNIIIIAISLILLIAAFAGYGFYNRYKLKQEARLQAEVHKQQEIETRSLFEGEQKERIRIARDLHDSIGQMLSVIKMNVSNIPESATSKVTLELVDNTITEVRNISHNLIPEELNFGLFSALEDMCDKINQTNSTQASLNVPDEVREHQFEKSNELSIYRIVQEVLNNMVKHSEASQIAIDVVQNTNTFTIGIKDNGKGFDTAQINRSKGLGWKNIAARVNLLDGQMQVRSEQLTGTQIEITIPSA